MEVPGTSELHTKLRELANEYPQALIQGQLRDVPRMAFHLKLVMRRVPKNARVGDVGGGVGLFSVGAKALGCDSVLVDDFRDAVNLKHGDKALTPHRKHGVEVISRDVVADGVDFAPASFDAITSFDSLEHWHHSPKKLLHQLMKALKPGGWLILGAPNCVNMRKRLTVPWGRGKWSSMAEWYEEPVFRGHVREPDVRDLRYIADDLKLTETKIIGRNWQGRVSPIGLVRAMTAIFDLPLRINPAWCADLYLLGRKSG